jgi:hypothetical protein
MLVFKQLFTFFKAAVPKKSLLTDLWRRLWSAQCVERLFKGHLQIHLAVMPYDDLTLITPPLLALTTLGKTTQI